MASSSSSHQHNIDHLAFSGIEPDSKRRKYSESSRLFDVFINHRGPDAKETLAEHLYNSLQGLGLRPFLDSKETELGDYFPSTLETAIRSASVHIAIFSERYAQSAWCLAELVLMLESEAKIFPLFYGVKPWELRFVGNGVYAEAFTNYEKKGRYLQKLESWKKALHSASFFNGLEIDNAESFRNSEGFKNLVLDVQKEVERTKPLFVAKHPVALHKLVKDFESQCLEKIVHDFESQCGLNRKGKGQSKIFGIFGMGGAGKTTLAKELFNRKRSNYTATCFLFDVREKSSTSGLPSLQVKLLKDLFNENLPEFESREEGCNYIRDHLKRSKFSSFLIVLDDIDHVKQLDTLCLMDMANNSHNSLVIVTTRDVGVLTSAGIANRYNLKGLNRDDGRELFCWHSFDQPNPASGYESLVDAFIDVCGGLPLSLQVLGRHVYDRPVYYWELQLCKARESLDPGIKDILKISFDALSRVEKQIFMDIACFFVDESKNTAIRVWEGSGWHARYALETLKDRCLIEEGERLDRLLWEHKPVVLKMHDHLRDLGREMSEELKSPPRHWSPKNRKSLETKGFKTILAQTKGRCFHSIYDRSMGSQITYFMGESEERGETSSSLLWLQLDLNCRELSSIPPWIPLQNLQSLRVSHGYLKELWQSNVQAPSQLKELQMYQTTLEEFPDFSGIPNNLEQVVLDAKDMPIESWSLLESLRVYPRSLVLACSTLNGELACNNRGDKATFKSSCFTRLVIRNFVKLSDELGLYNIGESTADKYPLSNVENLEINHQIYVKKIFICGNYCPSILSLKIHDMESLIEMNLLEVKTLNCLEINRCWSLKILSETCNFRSLVVFDIGQCPELEELSVAHLKCLEKITINNCEQLKIVSGLSNLRKLVNFNISQCPVLEELCVSHLACLTLEKLTIKNCEQLKIVSDLSNLRKLVKLDIFHCSVLELCFADVSSLKEIRIGGELKCLELKGWKESKLVEMFNLEKIVTLIIRDCPGLQELVIPECPNCLERIIIRSCQILKKVSGNFNAAKVLVSDCPELEELPCFAGLSYLEEISFFSCRKLQLKCLELNSFKKLKMVEMFNLEKLVTLNIHGCPNFLERINIESCQNLKRVSGEFDPAKLSISDCPELEELPCFAGLTYLEEISIFSCGKLQEIILPTTLSRLHLNACRMLKSLSEISHLRNLVELNISQCWDLELELHLQGMEYLERFVVDECPKINSLWLYRCQFNKRVSGNFDPVVLHIKECPELEELPCFARLTCLEYICIFSCGELQNIHLEGCEKFKKIDIKYCKKLQNITLPTTLISLSVNKGCRELQRVEGIGDLTELRGMNISECPELEELPSLSRMRSLKMIKIDSCEKLQGIHVEGCDKLEDIDIKYCKKMKNITLPSQLINLSVKGCRELQRLAGIADVTELRGMNLSECPELEELPSLSRFRCLQDIEIDSCAKLEFEFLCLSGMKFLERVTFDRNVKVKYFDLDSCQNLETIMFGCEKLIELRIQGCPKLEKLPAFKGAVCLERVIIDGCGNFNCLQLDGCQNLRSVSGNFELTKLYINQCPELEELASLSSMRLLEEIDIKHCQKMKNITLPSTLISLSIWHCRDLQRISVTGDFMEITKMFSIWNCAMLEELPMLATGSCTEEIKIHHCEKLQNIMLPSRLIRLYVWNCRDLQRISVTDDFMELATGSCTEEIKIHHCEKLQNITLPSRLIRLYVWNCRDLQRISVTGEFMEITKHLKILDCAMLEELPMIDARSCVEQIFISGCEKVENITGIKELRGLGWMNLHYCSNALILYYIHKLKNVPSAMIVIGRAVDEAESILNEDVFNDGVDGVVEIAAHTTYPKWSELSGVIFCFVVVFDASTSVREGEWIKVRERYCLKVREGKWIITLVAFHDSRYDIIQEMKDAVLEYGIIKKGFRVDVKTDVWKSLGVLKTIVDRLHQS